MLFDNNLKKEEGKEKMEATAPAISLIYIRYVFWFLLVLAVGFLALNQGTSFFLKAQLLSSPCELCVEYNPGVEECIDRLNDPRPSYYTAEGWTDPFNDSPIYVFEDISPQYINYTYP